jgi:hypothetical protein
LREARAEEIRVRTAERMNELIPTSEALAVVSDIAGITLTVLSGLAASCTRDLSLRRLIDDRIYDLRLALSKRFEQQAWALHRTGKATTAPPSYHGEGNGDAAAR